MYVNISEMFTLREHKFKYSVTKQEVNEFIAANDCIREFLNKFQAPVSREEKAVGLARFFKWLRVVKKLDMSPSEFLDTHLDKTNVKSVEERRWALKLALQFSRDNPDLETKAINYKYGSFFLPIKAFCDYNEVGLTENNGFFPKRERRKYQEKPFTAEYIRRALSVLSQRERSICMVELQAGQSIKQVLVDVNHMARYIFKEIDSGKQRIRIDFNERKGNGFSYFTFISADAIQEIQKWRQHRQRILSNLGLKESDWIWINEKGEPSTRKDFHNSLRLKWNRAKLRTGPLSIRSHGFRKFFEQEASPPERNISKAYITFMMGHSEGRDSGGIRVTHALDAVGGTYDHAPWVYPDAVEKEYVKLEPYLNIYTSKAMVGEKDRKELDDMRQQMLNTLQKKLEEQNKIIESFQGRFDSIDQHVKEQDKIVSQIELSYEESLKKLKNSGPVSGE